MIILKELYFPSSKEKMSATKDILVLSVSLCVIASTGMDVIKTLEYAIMGCVPMDGVEVTANKVLHSFNDNLNLFARSTLT